MAIVSNSMTTTTNASYIQSLWGPKLNDFYRANLKAASFFTDLSGEAAEGANVIYIPNISEMTANSKTVGSQVTLNKQTATKVTLTINQWYEVSFLLEDEVAAFMKKSYNMQERWMKNAAYTVANKLEVALLNLCRGFSQIVGDSSHSFNDSSIRAAINYLDVANVPMEDRAFFLYPSVIWKHIMNQTKYSLTANTNGADPVLKGAIGFLLGIPVYSTTNLSVYLGHRDGMLAGKDALCFATARVGGNTDGGNHVRLQTQYLQDYLGTLVTADLIYGVIENRDTSGVWIKAQST